jgi:hypothetical protein
VWRAGPLVELLPEYTARKVLHLESKWASLFAYGDLAPTFQRWYPALLGDDQCAPATPPEDVVPARGHEGCAVGIALDVPDEVTKESRTAMDSSSATRLAQRRSVAARCYWDDLGR